METYKTGEARYMAAAQMERNDTDVQQIVDACGYKDKQAYWAAKTYYSNKHRRYDPGPEKDTAPTPDTIAGIAGRRIPIPQTAVKNTPPIFSAKAASPAETTTSANAELKPKFTIQVLEGRFLSYRVSARHDEDREVYLEAYKPGSPYKLLIPIAACKEWLLEIEAAARMMGGAQ